MEWQTDILGEDFQPAPSRRPVRTAWSARPPWCGTWRSRPRRRRRPAGGRCCSCTAGATTSSTRNWRSSGPGRASSSSPWTCTTTAGACAQVPTAAMSPISTTTTPRSRRRSASSVRSARTDPPGRPLTLMGHSTGGLIAALWASRHPGAGRSAGPGQPVAGGARQPRGAPRRPDHGGALRPVLARNRHPPPRACILLAQHQQLGRGRMGTGRHVPAAAGLPGPRRLAQCGARRPGQGGARAEHRRPDPGAHLRRQRQRDVLEGIDAPHGCGPGRQYDRPPRPEPGPHRDAGADRRRTA